MSSLDAPANRHWSTNPMMVDAQAQDRAHRIGQKNEVGGAPRAAAPLGAVDGYDSSV